MATDRPETKNNVIDFNQAKEKFKNVKPTTTVLEDDDDEYYFEVFFEDDE